MRPNLKLAREARSVFMGLANCRWEMGFNQGVLYVLSELEKDTDDTAVGATQGRCIDRFKAAMLKDLEKYNAGEQQMLEASNVYRKGYDRMSDLIFFLRDLCAKWEALGLGGPAAQLRGALKEFSRPVQTKSKKFIEEADNATR